MDITFLGYWLLVVFKTLVRHFLAENLKTDSLRYDQLLACLLRVLFFIQAHTLMSCHAFFTPRSHG